MLLTISTSHHPATDLGYLLHKHPSKRQTFRQTFGSAHVFYPEATDERCTVAMLLDVDPIGLVRGKAGSQDSGPLDQYVNDRPYAATSLLSVAIADVFGTAMAGRCKERPELVSQPLPLTTTVTALPCRGGIDVVARLFEPLGYTVTTESVPLDDRYPAWGAAPYVNLTIAATVPLSSLLSHLYVLIPTMDGDKHYFIGDDEVDKLLRNGEGWLAGHPERDLIVRRYLRNQRSLMNDALARLSEDTAEEIDGIQSSKDREEEAVERKVNLHEQRLVAVFSALKESGARRILDLGCGEGRLIAMLIREPAFTEILGMDVSHRALEIATDRLKVDRMPEQQRTRLSLIQGSLMYRDERLAGFDAAAIVEVIEHLDEPRLAAFERVVFEFACPGTVVITTPNSEYNELFESLPAGKFRHRDHRFEWTRAQFETWGDNIAERFGYLVSYSPVGPLDADHGAPSQMAVFQKSRSVAVDRGSANDDKTRVADDQSVAVDSDSAHDDITRVAGDAGDR